MSEYRYSRAAGAATLFVLLVIAFGIGWYAGYDYGWKCADHWYARHPVTLIAPVKYRVPAPQAQIEQPKEKQQ